MASSNSSFDHASSAPQWAAGSAPVAVVMISLNEAHNMQSVIDNLRGWVQEVFLVDSYSSDHTVDIALANGVHVVQRRFRDFGDQWNFALDHLPIQAPWVMKLDPDERLTDELKQGISDAIARDVATGLSFSRRLWFMGKPLPVRQEMVRVWRAGCCRFTDVVVNEHPLVDGEAVHVEGDLEHHDSPDLHHWLNKQNHYTTAEAVSSFLNKELSVDPVLFGTRLQRRMWLKKHFMKVPGRYVAMFMYYYFIKGLWRAGWVGYAWSRLRCDVYRLWEYKLKEMKLTGKTTRIPVSGHGEPHADVQQYD